MAARSAPTDGLARQEVRAPMQLTELTGLTGSPAACRDSSAPLGDRVGVPRGGTGFGPTLPCRGTPARKNRIQPRSTQ